MQTSDYLLQQWDKVFHQLLDVQWAAYDDILSTTGWFEITEEPDGMMVTDDK